MNSVLYIIAHQYINRIKQIFSRPLSAIITIIACLGFIGGPVIAFIMPKKGISDIGMAEIVVAGVQLFIGIIMINAFLSQQSGLFTLADANFLFGAPLHRRTMLMYAMLQTAPASLMTALFMCFYFPFIMGNAMSAGDFIASLFIMALMFGCIYLSYYYIYIQDIAHPGLRKLIKKIFWLVMAIFALIVFIVLYKSGFNFTEAASKIIKSTIYNAIPVFGWAKYGIISAINGDYLVGFLLSAFLLCAYITVFVILMYRSEVDFYEQAQQDSIRVQEIMDSVKTGNVDARKYQITKVHKANVKFKTGAGAILSRQMLEYKKSGSFVTIRELVVGLIYVAVGVIAKLDFSFVMAMMLFGALSFSTSDSWNSDFKKPYVFLIPASSLKKVLYSVIPGLLKAAISGLVALLAGAVAYKLAPVDAICNILIYFSYILIFTFAGVFTYRILGRQANAMATMFLRMLMLMIAAIPASVLIVVIAALNESAPNYMLITAVSCVVNILESGILAFLSRRLFEQSELMG